MLVLRANKETNRTTVKEQEDDQSNYFHSNRLL